MLAQREKVRRPATQVEELYPTLRRENELPLTMFQAM
jgi:hypothetical protein